MKYPIWYVPMQYPIHWRCLYHCYGTDIIHAWFSLHIFPMIFPWEKTLSPHFPMKNPLVFIIFPWFSHDFPMKKCPAPVAFLVARSRPAAPRATGSPSRTQSWPRCAPPQRSPGGRRTWWRLRPRGTKEKIGVQPRAMAVFSHKSCSRMFTDKKLGKFKTSS